ncbi:MAG: ParB/RepB/Spo0J family partition protein [Parcubacteria group bacterium]|nr:ParB/RepB/Spo0J family partition protein [Parcubacteria group bacterium]
MKKQNHGLGRGLGSLIPNKSKAALPSPANQQVGAHTSVEAGVAQSAVVEIPVEKIVSNRHQPRKHFVQEELERLAQSIREHGIIQPLVVVADAGGQYELIAGERRLRAAKMAGLATVPTTIRKSDELERLELALIENIQRSDLNPIEEAESYQKLNDEFGLTHQQIADRMGKTRPLISNAIRLLSLPAEIQMALAERRINAGHARAILEVHDDAKRMALFKKILAEKLSIVDATHEARTVEVHRHTRTVNKDPNIEAYEAVLANRLGTRVSIGRKGKNTGIIAIEFYAPKELDAIMAKLLGDESVG